MPRKQLPDVSRDFLARFGQAVRDLRVRKGWVQGKLGSRLDVPGSRVSEIERGSVDTSVSRAASLAQALEVPLSDLIRHTEELAPDGESRRATEKRVSKALSSLGPRELRLVIELVEVLSASSAGR
jgi:transcriptional regulator with XRE-family HTH domain